MPDIRLYGLEAVFDLIPLGLPIFDLAVHVKHLLSIQLLTFRLDLLVLPVDFIGLIFQKLALPYRIFLYLVLLFLQDVVHLHRSYLEVLPSLEHVSGVKRGTCNGADVHVFLFYSFDLLKDVLFGIFDLIEVFDHLRHFFHVLRLALQLAHNVADVLLYLLALKFDGVFDEVDDAFDVQVQKVAQVFFEELVVD